MTESIADLDNATANLDRPFHTMKKQQVMEILNVNQNGLTTEEVEKRRAIYGTNELQEEKGDTILQLFLNQFKDTLIIILIFAAIVSGYIGYHENEGFVDAILITTILIINAVMGVYQEWKADKAIEALKNLVTHEAQVIRNNEIIKINSPQLVPGDIVIIEQGDRISADGRIIESINLRTEEAQLTGESTDVSKSSFEISEINSPLGDRSNSVYMGTHVTFGKGKFVVTRTGMKTEMGKIADSVQEISKEPTPTQVKLDNFGKKLSGIILALMVVMVIYGVLFSHIEFTEMMLIAVSLAVAAIPEGLAIVITLALALGVQRMAKQQSIVKKLPAVESLGSVTTICTDKTGTLTLNQMTVRKLVTFNKDGYQILTEDEFSGNKDDVESKDVTLQMLNSAVLCNNATLTDEERIGDPTELALLRVVDTIGINRKDEYKKYSRLDELPFDSERKQMTVVVENNETQAKYAYSKGAPEVILNSAKFIDIGDGPIPLTDEYREKIMSVVDNLAEDALRVLGFGYYKLQQTVYNLYKFEEKLVFSGLMGMIDPPKEGVAEAVQECHEAGINVKMVTGDHKKTAVAIAQQIGITNKHSNVVEGIELDTMTDEELEEKIQSINVFARISPTHKLRIVRALKAKGEIVAMTGDGVNDAPALKGADIGIAMGSGTDVTKETADMILEDDNFTTIVHAIEEGRSIYDNMTKFVRYMLSSNTAEIIVIFLGIMLGLPVPLVAVQILWVNLVTDGVPALALGVDPAEEGIMVRPPRDPDENLLSKERVNHIILFGLWMSFVTLGSYVLFYSTEMFGTKGDVIKARTIAFTILSFSQFAHALNVREATASILNANILKNKVLIFTVIISIIIQVFLIHGDGLISMITGSETHFLNELFEITPLNGSEWLFVGLVSFSLVFFAETLKVIKRKTKYKAIC